MARSCFTLPANILKASSCRAADARGAKVASGDSITFVEVTFRWGFACRTLYFSQGSGPSDSLPTCDSCLADEEVRKADTNEITLPPQMQLCDLLSAFCA